MTNDDDLAVNEHGVTISLGCFDCTGSGQQVTITSTGNQPDDVAAALLMALKGLGQVRGADTLLAIQRRIGDYARGE